MITWCKKHVFHHDHVMQKNPCFIMITWCKKTCASSWSRDVKNTCFVMITWCKKTRASSWSHEVKKHVLRHDHVMQKTRGLTDNILQILFRGALQVDTFFVCDVMVNGSVPWPSGNTLSGNGTREHDKQGGGGGGIDGIYVCTIFSCYFSFFQKIL